MTSLWKPHGVESALASAGFDVLKGVGMEATRPAARGAPRCRCGYSQGFSLLGAGTSPSFRPGFQRAARILYPHFIRFRQWCWGPWRSFRRPSSHNYFCDHTKTSFALYPVISLRVTVPSGHGPLAADGTCGCAFMCFQILSFSFKYSKHRCG